MADFSNMRARRERFTRATGLMDRVISAYHAAAGVRDELAAFQASSDPDLVEAINAVYSQAQRQEIAQIAQKLAALAADLEANHAGVVQLGNG